MDSMLPSNIKQAGLVSVDYADWGNRAMSVIEKRPSQLGVTYFPHVAVGWDGSPRNYPSGIVTNASAENYELFLRKSKAWLDQHPESKDILTLNSWNEWVEGSYIEPDTLHGTKYLDAIRKVFGKAQ